MVRYPDDLSLTGVQYCALIANIMDSDNPLVDHMHRQYCDHMPCHHDGGTVHVCRAICYATFILDPGHRVYYLL